jgi:hypothetical protein
MSSPRPSIFRAAATAYRDLADALAAMRGLAVTTAAIIFAAEILNWALNSWVIPAESLLGREIMPLVITFLVTPFLIAVHRHVLLREITPSYEINPSERRFQLFFGWSMVFFLLGAFPRVLVAVVAPGRNVAFSFVVLGLLIALTVVSVRTVILFPAIAVDAPGATWENAVRDTKGHGWWIFFLLFAVMVPFTAVAMIVIVVALASPLGVLLLVPLECVGMIVLLGALVAAASRLYERLGDRVNQPPPASTADD